MAATDNLHRVRDRARGFFCKPTKEGGLTSIPPTSRDPKKSKANPRAVRHIGKTAQDAMPPAQRPRVQDAQRRAERMRAK